ncbi:MAG: 50S ribosomal protein L1 [Planctomycetota bacterium]|nr:MAG: 50S ribosomal protein L1 [Planctomycetota bacterium]RLS48413.1 MAG: 50S ribosomal protein L1 [Planctomycetota bacterium]
MVGNSKRMRASQSHVVVNPVTAAEAIAALRKFKATKFDQTVNVVFHLGIDPKAADQALRGSIALPHGIGKTARVIAFCGSDKVAAAKAAGAIDAGSDDLVAKVEGGWMEFDVAIASPDMMRVVSKLGKVLGPKGLMPSPKAGTVTPNVAEAVKEYAAGKQEYRNDDGGNIHGVIGKLSFKDDQLLDNLNAFVQTILKAKPASSKGLYVKKCVVAACMSPGVPVAV